MIATYNFQLKVDFEFKNLILIFKSYKYWCLDCLQN